MKAYLCETPDGPQYIHLQAEAKRLDKNFETEEIDLTKEALLERLNKLMRQAHAKSGSQPAASLEEETAQPPASAPPPALKPAGGMPPHAQRNEMQIEWEVFIWGIPAKEAYRLNVLSSVIAERRGEIEKGVNV